MSFHLEDETDPAWDTWQSICQDADKETAEQRREYENWKAEQPRR